MQSISPPSQGLQVAGGLFWLFALQHLLRVLFELNLIIGSLTLPVWASGLAAIGFGVLCGWYRRLAQPGNPPGCC